MESSSESALHGSNESWSIVIVGLGIDAIEIDRVAGLLQRYGARFRRRVFTDAEQRYCERRRRFAQHYAARFSAKEALLKALGTGLRMGVRWREIEVVNLPSGKPTLRLSGRTAEHAAKFGDYRIELSLTHAQTVATAFVIIEATESASGIQLDFRFARPEAGSLKPSPHEP